MHITYQEWKQLEPTIRASQDTDAALAGVASKLLKHPVAESQIWYFRRKVLQLAPPIARWKFSAEDIQRLTDLMQQEGLVGPDGKGTFTHQSGARVSLRHEVYTGVAKDQHEAFHAWLRANGHGDLIKETVHAQTLKGWARERLEEGEPLPPMVAAHFETVAVATQPKGA